jgi:Tol biopolymer transport system component
MKRSCALLLMVCCAGCMGPPTRESDTLADVTQLTTGFARVGESAFSPDMNWIAFQATPPGEQGFSLYVAPVRKDAGQVIGLGTPIRVTPPGTRNSRAAISPDGFTMIFASSSGRQGMLDENTRLRKDEEARRTIPTGLDLFRADGWQSAVVLPDPAAGTNLAQFPLTKFGNYTAEMSITPDGKSILYSSNTTDASGDIDLYLSKLDGSSPQKLTDLPGHVSNAQLAPDGRNVVLAYYRVAGSSRDVQVQVAGVRRDASGNIVGLDKLNPVTTGNANWSPAWHRTGYFVMYVSSPGSEDKADLWLVRKSGRQACRITFAEGLDTSPSFSADGKYLLWTSARPGDGTTQLYLARFTVPDYAKMYWDERDQ